MGKTMKQVKKELLADETFRREYEALEEATFTQKQDRNSPDGESSEDGRAGRS